MITPNKLTALAVALLIPLATAGPAFAMWQPYREDASVVASFDYDSFASIQGKPSVRVRWHYVTPRNGVGGVKIQFTADCAARKLFEIASTPYDPQGNYMESDQHQDQPKEYAVTPGSLNEATYKLLCR